MDKSRIKGKGISVVMRAEGSGRKVRSQAHQMYILPFGYYNTFFLLVALRPDLSCLGLP